MNMLPNNGIDITQYSEPTISPSYTWKLDPNKNKIADFVDELDSVEQACYMMLRTELGKYEIYPEWYGIELNDLYGCDRDLVEVRLPRRIEECLMVDKRINSVSVESIEFEGSKCICRVTVDCIYGNFETDVSYEIN